MGTISNSGFRFFPRSSSVLSAMPVSPEDVHDSVINPLRKIMTQAEKAAQIRQNTTNNQAVDVLKACSDSVIAIMNSPSNIAKPTEGNDENVNPTHSFNKF